MRSTEENKVSFILELTCVRTRVRTHDDVYVRCTLGVRHI